MAPWGKGWLAISSSRPVIEHNLVYPESDGQPMAENTLQCSWIAAIEGGLETLFQDDSQVFVTGDLFWYPVEEHPRFV